MHRTKLMQQIVYQLPASAFSDPSRLKPLDRRLIHSCACTKLIVSVRLFDNDCKTRFYGRVCKYSQGHSLSELEELIDLGYKADFYEKYICCPRPG